MTHMQAETLAWQLMAQHGLTAAGWRFEWSGGRRQLGLCQVRRTHDPRTGQTHEVKILKLSRHLVALNSDEEIRDTILHEIAHALAGLHNGHNLAWRQACLRIGAKPQRTAGRQVKIVAAPYAIVCGGCSRSLAERHRRPAPARLSNSYCLHCGPQSKGQLRLVERVAGMR